MRRGSLLPTSGALGWGGGGGEAGGAGTVAMDRSSCAPRHGEGWVCAVRLRVMWRRSRMGLARDWRRRRVGWARWGGAVGVWGRGSCRGCACRRQHRACTWGRGRQRGRWRRRGHCDGQCWGPVEGGPEAGPQVEGGGGGGVAGIWLGRLRAGVWPGVAEGGGQCGRVRRECRRVQVWLGQGKPGGAVCL